MQPAIASFSRGVCSAVRARAMQTRPCSSGRPQLLYFQIRGRAEPLRLLLADSLGFEGWEDVWIAKGAEWETLKAASPLGSVPILRWGGGIEVAQTLGIASYIGAKLGCQGETDEHRAVAQTLMTCAYIELCSPLSNLFWAPIRLEGIPLAAVVDSYVSKVVDLCARIQAISVDRSGGPFVLGQVPCAADFFIAEWSARHRECFANHASLQLPGWIRGLEEAVMGRPNVREYAARAYPRLGRVGDVDDAPLRWTNSPGEADVRAYIESTYEYGGNAALGRGAF